MSIQISALTSDKLFDPENGMTELVYKLKNVICSDGIGTAAGASPFISNLTIFILACFVGYYVVWKVTPALHAPLMSVTNAISGIIIIGALIAASSEVFSLSSFLGLAAVFFAAINIFGGFVVTHRMLQMFKKK